MGKRQPKKKRGINPRTGRIPTKILDPITYDGMNFSWRVHDGYIDYEHPEFGWVKVTILDFLQKIVQRLQSYEGLIWHELKQDHRCHPWGLDEIPKECYERLEERQIDITELYQIPLGNKPRIIGYKTGSIFYLMWYDQDHKFCPTKAK